MIEVAIGITRGVKLSIVKWSGNGRKLFTFPTD